jgi:hypothetical protein
MVPRKTISTADTHGIIKVSSNHLRINGTTGASQSKAVLEPIMCRRICTLVGKCGYGVAFGRKAPAAAFVVGGDGRECDERDEESEGV